MVCMGSFLVFSVSSPEMSTLSPHTELRNASSSSLCVLTVCDTLCVFSILIRPFHRFTPFPCMAKKQNTYKMCLQIVS